MYPSGVHPSVERGPDGFCKKIRCYKRCLPATAMIATPAGQLPIARLSVGDPVWTVDASGARTVAPIARLESIAVGQPYAVVEVVLADGRVVRASAEHPTAGGRWIGRLEIGSRLDGSAVVGRRQVPYRGEQTWDLLPDGPTGRYWADQVLLDSTLVGQPE